MYVCVCEAVTENEVNAEIALGARSVEEIGERCGAGTSCGMCHDRIRGLLPIPSAARPTEAASDRAQYERVTLQARS
jgi:bacterioferritin-associated ferredoxin